jgi:hypothetical protein
MANEDVVNVEAGSFEEALNQALEIENALDPDQRKNLSKVLFPDTHVAELLFAGEQRKLRPLTVKFSRRMHEALIPFSEKAKEAAISETPYDVDPDMLKALYDMANILAEYYGWEDVPGKVATEDVLLSELQSLAVNQQELQGENDFLLSPLRIVIKLMQTREILSLRVLATSKNLSSTPA